MPAIEKLTANFTETDIDDEIIIMRLDNGELLSLEGSGAQIWRLIDGHRDREALISSLAAAHFDVERQKLSGDVDAFLAQLRDAGLIDGR